MPDRDAEHHYLGESGGSIADRASAGTPPSLGGSPLPAIGSGEVSDLAHALEPALHAACAGRLDKVQWFHSAWQAGGAATGFSRLRVDDEHTADVVVKLPVGPAEYRWTTALGGMPHLAERIADGPLNGDESHLVELSPGYACAMGPTPRVYAAGTELGGYDLAWLVVERLAGPPLSKHLGAAAIEDLLTTAAEWYLAAECVRPAREANVVMRKDWTKLIERARSLIPDIGIHDEDRWKAVLDEVARLLPKLLEIWDSRDIDTWCHGDLHPGNAMRRGEDWYFAGDRRARRGGCVLIDLALVHPGHWVEDAVYLERLFWGRQHRLEGIRPVAYLAQARRELGLPTWDDYTQLANVRRALMGASVPCFMTHEGHPKYISGALDMLERITPLLRQL